MAALAQDDYEPPRLSAGQLAGDYRGDHGAVLRLAPGGRAELTRVPAQPDFEADQDYTRCGGTGATWTRDRYGDREAVLVRLDGDCGEATHWRIGGSEQAPELFALFGDPDAGDLLILAPEVGGSRDTRPASLFATAPAIRSRRSPARGACR
ncbi:hypothetical protein STENM327S_02659 [Streptomyces tendae]